MMTAKEKISIREKMAYGFTDLASSLVWATVGSYLLFFYTDVFGLAAGAVGTLFLITRILDAVIDPVLGIVIDHTHSKYGKCRPYFLWMAVPLSIFMILTFITPDFSDSGKLIYAYVTYGILGIIYSAINLPVTAILPRIAVEPDNRTVLGTFRMFGALTGGLLIGVFTLPLVNFIGNGDDQLGFQWTMTIYAILALLLFLFAFFNLKEKVPVDKAEASQPVTEGFKAMRGNMPWLIMLLVGLMAQMLNAMRMSSSVYYLTYNLGRQDLVPLMTMMTLFIFLPMVLTPFVAGKIGKRNTVIMGNLIALVGYLIIYPLGINSVPLLFAGSIVVSIGTGFAFALLFVMISDSVDYGEWKNGVRAEGLLSAAASFGQKVGVGVGGAVAAWILAFGGYVGGAETQSQSALDAIAFNFAIIPIIGTIITLILLYFYKLDKDMSQMTKDLRLKREAKEAKINAEVVNEA